MNERSRVLLQHGISALSDQFKLRLSQLAGSSAIGCLADLGHGIEKESLRVDPEGHIAKSGHPAGLGSPLTHPSITTDFSEALLEFITPVFHKPEESLAYLSDLHTFLFTQMDREEILWTSSMPCVLDDESQIPLARYGYSNIGKLKTLYRMGLSHRYGRAMQTIAGIHFNFSLPDSFWAMYRDLQGSSLDQQAFKTEQYFNLIRNFRRYCWLLLYLFGASPAVCRSFIRGRKDHGLESYDNGTLYMPYGTCLRMGDLGYTSNAQSTLFVSYNSLEEYARDLTWAIKTPYEPYQKFGPVDGKYRQLNDSILQIENEFYSTIRPKRKSDSGDRPVNILRKEGVEYVEVRCLDLNPFLPVGIDEEEIRFLSSFLICCLLRASPATDAEERLELDTNLKLVVNRGREPGLQLERGGNAISMQEWAREILDDTREVAQLLDKVNGMDAHVRATDAQLAKLADPAKTPSAKVLQRMDELGTPYFIFAMNQSLANSDYYRSLRLDDQTMTKMKEMVAQSDQERIEIEKEDNVDFDTFLANLNAS